MIKLSEISYREEDWSEEIGDRYLVNMTFEDGAYTVAAYEKIGGQYGVPDTKLRYGDPNKAKKRYKDLIRKYTRMCESVKLRIKESSSAQDAAKSLNKVANNIRKFCKSNGLSIKKEIFFKPEESKGSGEYTLYITVPDRDTFEFGVGYLTERDTGHVLYYGKLTSPRYLQFRIETYNYEEVSEKLIRFISSDILSETVCRFNINNKRFIESEYDTAADGSGEYFGVEIFDDYDSIIVYSKDYTYIEKVYDLMYSYASDWADDHYKDIDKYGDSIANTCFDYIEDKLYRRGLSDFESDFIKGRKGIDRDTATLKDGTVVKIIEKIDLSKML